MLKELKFVQGSVAKKSFIPELTHFRIESGVVRGYNGSLALSANLGIDITCTPLAAPLVKAIQHCEEDTIKLTLTPKGQLRIQSGGFKALINCVQETKEYTSPHALPEGGRFELDGESLLVGAKALQPFISTDASRPWSNGVLFKGQSMFATNNVTAVEYWAASAFPFVVNLPRDAIKEIVRINEPPLFGQWTDKSLTFHYESGKWIRCQLLSQEWPDISKLLEGNGNVKAIPAPEGLFDACEKLKGFTDKLGRVIFEDGRITTCTDEGATAAEMEIEGLEGGPIFNVDMLKLIGTVTTSVDFSTYPKPCIFYGDRLRGAIIGLRP